ncbi:MAG: outer membrane lipoprotein carrier protein LolA [Alphaproteobacteria bacterium]|nr:outer membrane lipoprotein carrier protein LolA [Alphaproteobacteria bacterium]
MRRAPALLVTGLLLAAAAMGAPRPSDATAESAARDTERREVVAEVEGWLTGLSTLRAKFIQNDSEGAAAAGVVMLRRPGLMRFEYEPPGTLELISNGVFLVVVDHQLRQINNIPLHLTPLSVLTAEQVDLERAYEVTGTRRTERVIEITIRSREDPDAGSLRLSFSRSPLMLRQWLVTDAQGLEVRVSLFEIQRGVELERSLFNVDQDQFEDDPGSFR